MSVPLDINIVNIPCEYMYMHVSSIVQEGCSPLYMASQHGHTGVVDTLLKCGADPNLAWTVWGTVVFIPSFAHVPGATSDRREKYIIICTCPFGVQQI